MLDFQSVQTAGKRAENARARGNVRGFLFIDDAGRRQQRLIP